MHTSSLFSFCIVVFSAWAVYGASWYPRAFGFRRSLEMDSIADTRQNLMPRHDGEAIATFRPTGTGVSPPSSTGCPFPIIGVARQDSKGKSVIPQGCPGPNSVNGGVAPSGTGTGTAGSAGTGLPTRVANVTVASTGVSLPVGTVTALRFSLPVNAAPTAGPGRVRSFKLPYGA